jgi:hypothetical protein
MPEWFQKPPVSPARKPPRALGASRLTSSCRVSRRRSPFARKEPLHRTRILSKPRRLRRFSTSDARFALFNIKRDIAHEVTSDCDFARDLRNT